MSPPSVPPEVARFRAEYAARVPRWYSGVLHLGWTVSIMLACIGLALARAGGGVARAWPVIPVALLVASLVEYLLHRHILHHPVWPFRALYRIHALEHHRYFTDEAMAFSSPRDFMMVLFPPLAPLTLALLLHLAFGPLLGRLFSTEVAALFSATVALYFLLYEGIHLAGHLRDDHPVARLPLLAALRAHHRLHHRLSEMAHVNFNIPLPLWDAVFRTARVEPRRRPD